MLSPLPARAHSLNSVRSCSCESLVITDFDLGAIIHDFFISITQYFSSSQLECSSGKFKTESSELISNKLSDLRLGIGTRILARLQMKAVETTDVKCLQDQPRIAKRE